MQSTGASVDASRAKPQGAHSVPVMTIVPPPKRSVKSPNPRTSERGQLGERALTE